MTDAKEPLVRYGYRLSVRDDSAHRDAERAVIEAAKAWATNQRGWLKPLDEALAEAVTALRGLHGHAQSDCGHVWVDAMYGQYCKNCRAMRSVSQGDA